MVFPQPRFLPAACRTPGAVLDSFFPIINELHETKQTLLDGTNEKQQWPSKMDFTPRQSTLAMISTLSSLLCPDKRIRQMVALPVPPPLLHQLANLLFSDNLDLMCKEYHLPSPMNLPLSLKSPPSKRRVIAAAVVTAPHSEEVAVELFEFQI
ncbi:hypothetical protein DM860_005039 [Cuscuta australis]|uniref:Uncharacterized protein n=1 Tax=Cuscuta australis TaxID=267555 RepID=A0A328DNC4_9ASTE|nr:hypothetical protein DM860_005039 [Cuscuta australis]